MISFSCINIVSKYLNSDVSNCNSSDINDKAEKINRNLVKNFKLPIQYLDNTELFSITDNVSDDLELITTQNEKQKTMYHYLFKPTNHFGENLIPEWKKYYTTNIKNVVVPINKILTGTIMPIDIERWLIHDGHKIFENETLYVTIPKGVDDGEIVLIKDKGNIAREDCK